MCTIAINPASIVAVPIGTTGTLVTVSGTIANCVSNAIKVTITCPGSSVFVGAVITGNTWTAQVDPHCICGTPVTITATCQDTVPCTATLNTVLNCGCCPQVSTTANQGLYNSSGQQLITFMTHLTFPSGCAVTVQRDFGDGTLGAIKTFTSLPNPNPYPETHAYSVGSSYTSNLNVLSYASCPPFSKQVIVSTVAPSCATSSFCAAVCRLFQFLFLLFGSTAGVLFIACTSPICNPPTAFPLLPVATGWAIAAGAFLLLLFVFCRKCVCGFWLKMLAQLLVIIGAVMFMFVPPQPNCTQPLPFPTPWTALWAALLVLIIGVFPLLYASWYQQLKTVCPLTICDFWQAIKDAATIAILAAFLVFSFLGVFVTVTHLGFALLVITLLLINVNHQIVVNQNAHNC